MIHRLQSVTVFFTVAVFILSLQPLFARGVNTPPTITPIAPQIVQENTPKGPIGFTVGDAESPASSLLVTAVSSDTTLILNSHLILGGTDAGRTLTIVPDSNVYGLTTVIVTVSDGLLTTSDTVSVKINNPPRLDMNVGINLLQGGTAVLTGSNLSAVDNDNTVAQVYYTLGPDSATGTPPLHGALRLNGNPLPLGGTFTQSDVNANRVTYRHDNSESTFDQFTFTVHDADGGLASDNGFTVFQFSISITPVNQPPVALDSAYIVGLGNTLHARFRAIDPDSPLLTFSIVTNGTKGTATIDSAATGQFTYIPQAGATGTDSISFQVTDGSLFSVVPGKVTITFQTLPPVALNGFAVTQEGASVSDTLRGSDPNIPAQPLTFSITTDAANGHASVLDSLTGRYLYTPNPAYFGPDSFKFRVKAATLQSAEATVMIAVRPKLHPGELLVADNKTPRIILVDSASGRSAVVAMGDSLAKPTGVVASPAGDLYVIDQAHGVIKINGATGAQTQVVPGSSFSAGPIGPTAIAMEHNGMLIVADGPNGVKRIDPKTGNVTVVSSGDSIKLALGVTVGLNGDIYVGDGAVFVGGTSKLIKVDPVSGAQSVISTGNSLLLPVGLAQADSGSLYVADPGTIAGASADHILKIDLTTGLQSAVLHTDTIDAPIGIAIGPNGNLFVGNNNKGNIISVNPADGSGGSVFSGLSQFQPFGLTVITAQPNFAASKNVVQFGQIAVGHSRTDSIIVQNSGSAPLVITSVVSDSAQFVPSPLSATIPAGGSQTFTVTFTPTTTDSISARIVFNHNGFDTPFILHVIGGTTVLGVKGTPGGIPKVYALYNNYPNPFNPATTIQFDLPHSSIVSLTLYDVLGRTVARIVDQRTYEAGRFSVVLDGSRLASGIYFYEIRALSREKTSEIFQKIGKMMLLK